jgi:hypothetical protein
MKEKMYEEVGTNYRFFLKWRHAALAGNLLVLGAVFSGCISALKDAKEILWLIPLCASPVGILLWIIDVRTRDLYHATIDAGKELEDGVKGFYTRLADNVRVPAGKSGFSQLTQSLALNVCFIGSPLLLLALSAFFARRFGM